MTERRTLPGTELALGDQSLSVSALWVCYGYTDQTLKQIRKLIRRQEAFRYHMLL